MQTAQGRPILEPQSEGKNITQAEKIKGSYHFSLYYHWFPYWRRQNNTKKQKKRKGWKGILSKNLCNLINTSSAFNTLQPTFSNSKHLQNAKPWPPSLGKGAQLHGMLWYSNSRFYSGCLQTQISQPRPYFSRDLRQLVKLSQTDAIHSPPSKLLDR